MIKYKYSSKLRLRWLLLLNIIEIQGKLGNGCTIPYVVWCDDGIKYVVKFPGNIEGKKTLVNEFIASNLCEYLDLPILKYKLIKVKKEDYNKNTEGEIIPLDGTAFGTIYNDNALIVLNSGMIINSINRNDAIKILIFDLLIGNFDRNKGNLMIDSVTKKLIMIDHTHIFNIGTLWDEYQLPRLIEEKFEVEKLHQFNYENILESINYNREFYNELNIFIKKVKNINRKFIENIMNKIPDDWEVTEKEKNLLVDYIYKRFNRVEETLKILNINGGDNGEV